MPDNPKQNVTFPSNGSQAHGYLAVPSGSGPGVVVIQEWWGLTSHIAGIADRLAGEGFVALAPDLYGGSTTHDPGEAAKLMQALPADRAARDLGGTVDHLLGRHEVTGEKLGVVGFCMGGRFALHLAAQRPDRIGACVSFYGVGADTADYSGLRAPVLAHYGEKDDFIPLESARQLITKIEDASGSKPEAHFYPAGHAFMNEENLLGTHDPQLAELAWGRTVEFLHRHLD